MLGVDACLLLVGSAWGLCLVGYFALGAGNFDPALRGPDAE